MILTQINFFSDVLTLRSTLNVILPQRKVSEQRQQPRPLLRTLYLLHGYSDDQTAWQRWTSVERYVEGLNLAVVMPAAHNSFYTDMVHGGKYFTFLTEEVPAVLQDMFPLSQEREDTFVAGLSMGGYGALKMALSRPDLYAAAASLSGAVDMREVVKKHDDPDNPTWLESMRNIFGDLESVPGSQHDLFTLAEQVSRAKIKPSLFQYCGTEDFLYADNLRFRDYVRTLPLELTYAEGTGDHTWGYWDMMIQKVLAWLPLK
jgi:S-formylglutathione hydrolase FrmB